MKDYTKGKKPGMLEPFFPNELFRHIIVACFLVVVELVSVMLFPLPFKFISKPDHIPWFLLPIYKLNKIIQSEILFISTLVLCAILFITWPFLEGAAKRNVASFDKTPDPTMDHAGNNKERPYLWQRPVSFAVIIITMLFVITLCFINL